MQQVVHHPQGRGRAAERRAAMYHAYWGLAHSPFAGSPLFYLGESQAEALARLRYASDYRRHCVLLGERGVGRSALVRRYAHEQRRAGRQAVIVGAPGVSSRELVWQIAAGLGLGPRPDEDTARLFRRLGDYAATAPQQSADTLILDDADQAGADLRVQLQRLLALSGPSAWLVLIAIAAAKNASRLGADLLEAADLRVDLEPWSEPDTIGYVQHALVTAGAERPIFEDEALAALYQLTDGVPRRVNRLADHALLGAAAEELEMVDAAMIEAAHDALSWAAAGPA